jgi:hypothetical protein
VRSVRSGGNAARVDRCEDDVLVGRSTLDRSQGNALKCGLVKQLQSVIHGHGS